MFELGRRKSPQERFEDLYGNAPCGFLVISPGGHIVMANRTIAFWLGHGDAAELLGKRLIETITLGGNTLPPLPLRHPHGAAIVFGCGTSESWQDPHVGYWRAPT